MTWTPRAFASVAAGTELERPLLFALGALARDRRAAVRDQIALELGEDRKHTEYVPPPTPHAPSTTPSTNRTEGPSGASDRSRPLVAGACDRDPREGR
jgi:hypothetical protein